MSQVYKRCTTCGTDQTLDQFRKQSANKDGLKYTCITCDDERNKKRYEAKKVQIVATVRAWQEKHNDKVKIYKRRYYKNNKKKTPDV